MKFILSMGISPLTVTLAVLVIGTPVTLLMMMSTMPKNNGGSKGFQNRSELSREKRWALIENIERVYDNFNLPAIQNLASEMMFTMTACTCKILQRVGVRKVVSIQRDEQRDQIASQPFASSDGKNDMLIDVAYCSYSEQYLDSSSDKVLYEKKWPKAMIILSAIKAAHTDGTAAKFCTQCGAPISLTGDFYQCDRCGAHYQSDAYEWTVTGIQAQNESKNELVSKLLTVLVIGTLALALISLPISFFPLHLIVYLLDAFMVGGMVCFLRFMKKNIKGSQDCQEHDSLFSRQAFQRRAEYLYRLYNQAKDLDVSLLQPFMDPKSFAKLKENNVLDDFYYLDNDFYQLLTPEFKIEDGKQWMDCFLNVFEVTINEKRKIKKKKKKVHMVLVRDKDCMTEIKNGAELYTCEHCQATVNLAQDGKCRHCGLEIDLLKHDWCIHSIEALS